MERLISLLIGYLFGCFLTAELVARIYAHTSAFSLGGTNNPGMANVMHQLGLVPGLLVLAGDLLKCILAMAIVQTLFAPHICVLYAGLGCTLGHDFPFWTKGKGGKGVAVTCIAVFLFEHFWGGAAVLTGAAIVLLTKYLCIGGVAIPALCIVPFWLKYGTETGLIMIFLTLLMLQRHYSRIKGIFTGETEKTDLIKKIRGH